MDGTDRIVVVTGAGSGIGAACARRFAEEGATVVGIDLAGASITAAVTDRAAVDAAVARIVAEHGGIDVVANVAGITSVGRFADLTAQAWERTLAVNTTGPFHLIQAALPHLLERRGNVVNVASVAGVAALPYQAGYAASKAALVHLTRSLAVEYAPDLVRFNAVCPGTVDTPMVRAVARTLPGDLDPRLAARMQGLMPGLIDADEIAATVAFLAGDEARSVTGAVWSVDRGLVG